VLNNNYTERADFILEEEASLPLRSQNFIPSCRLNFLSPITLILDPAAERIDSTESILSRLCNMMPSKKENRILQQLYICDCCKKEEGQFDPLVFFLELRFRLKLNLLFFRTSFQATKLNLILLSAVYGKKDPIYLKRKRRRKRLRFLFLFLSVPRISFPPLILD